MLSATAQSEFLIRPDHKLFHFASSKWLLFVHEAIKLTATKVDNRCGSAVVNLFREGFRVHCEGRFD